MNTLNDSTHVEESLETIDEAMTEFIGETMESDEQMFIAAENITLEHERLENEVIPVGSQEIEVVMAKVPIDELKLDTANPRIQFQLEATNKVNPTEEDLREILWEMKATKDLKRSIQSNKGLIDAIIVSGQDGTVFEGNCRLTSYYKLRDETNGEDPKWTHVRARILPPEVSRDSINFLLGELHIAGKNNWSPFEQAAHLYDMNEVGLSEKALSEQYRMSKSYVNSKIRAYRLMKQTFVPMAHEKKVEVRSLSGYWSWFEELYKACKPSRPGKEISDRIYDGVELEHKFCEWVLENKLPQASDVRNLKHCLDSPKAMELLEEKGGTIENAFLFVSASKPELNSKLWKQIAATTQLLEHMPYDEIKAIREGDAVKANYFDELLSAIERIKQEMKK